MSTDITTLVGRAAEFAAAAHDGQKRKYTGEPYIMHPARVAELVEQRGGSPEQRAAAWLHDVVEDCGIEVEQIATLFGGEVAGYVDMLTDVFTPQKFPYMNREERKALEARRLSYIAPNAKLIKLCDLIDNTNDIISNDPKFAITYLREKANVLEALGYRA